MELNEENERSIREQLRTDYGMAAYAILNKKKIDSMLKLLRGFGIREIARTGRIAMVRGNISSLPAEGKAAKSSAKK